MDRRLFLLGLGAASAGLAGCGGGNDGVAPLAAPASAGTAGPTIAQLAQATPDLSLLVEALAATGLDATLQQAGPFTVFAPTNAAFTSLLAELGLTKDQLFAQRDLLTTVLGYHVLAGRVASTDIRPGRAIAASQGGVFKIDPGNGSLVVTDGRDRPATITRADIPAANGVVHVIDRVLLPADKTVVQVAASQPQFGILVQAIQAAGLEATLSAPGPFTVFAPTDAAFAALLAELGTTAEQLLANQPLLAKVLTYHVVPGRVLRAEVPIDMPITTVEGEAVRVTADLKIVDARSRQAGIVATDIFATNGVVHVIDRVLLPA